ncbi:hypothetical protein ACEYW6_07555 [Nostoc sp. UIC 10607]|uniref:hypothetical protein n=1 Tax=Nostoc sp. UIC 10607 TaxID=3045935 RepID=UPI0039A1B2FF
MKRPTKKLLLQQLINLLLIMQILLAGMQTADKIHKGDSVTDTLIWLINQCIPVLQQVTHQEDEEKKSNE